MTGKQWAKLQAAHDPAIAAIVTPGNRADQVTAAIAATAREALFG